MAADKKKLVRKILASRNGTSIVSVLAAFVLLLMGISMFYTAILASQRMLEKSQEMNLTAQQALESFYMGSSGSLTDEEAISDSFGTDLKAIEADTSGVILQEVGGSARIVIGEAYE